MHRSNNFDFLRLLFASLVIVTHSYSLSGHSESDLLYQITRGQTVFSYISVRGFFIISGFLIFQSLQRSRSLLDFYWKRVLRLFPGLFIVLLLTVLLAPFVYQGIKPFWINRDAQTYLPNNLSLFRLQPGISGVFENNPYKGTINGSLWTIVYEFSMYMLLSLLFFIRQKQYFVKVALCIFLAAFVYLTYHHGVIKFGYRFFELDLLVELGGYFLVGSLLGIYDFEKLGKKALLIIIVVFGAGLSVSFATNTFLYTKYLLLPVFVLSIGLSSFPVINNTGKRFGDISYGIYLYAFPVQQTLVYFFHLDLLSLMIFSFLITLPLAFVSWHLIEKRALKLKNIKQTLLWKKARVV